MSKVVLLYNQESDAPFWQIEADEKSLRITLGFTEGLGLGDGIAVRYFVTGTPILASSFRLHVNGALQAEGVVYSLNYDLGLVTFTEAPASGETIVATYQKAVGEYLMKPSKNGR